MEKQEIMSAVNWLLNLQVEGKAAKQATSSVWGDLQMLLWRQKSSFCHNKSDHLRLFCVNKTVCFLRWPGDNSSCFRGNQNWYFKTKLDVFQTLTKWFVLRLNLNVVTRQKQKILPKESLKWSVVAFTDANLRTSPWETKRRVEKWKFNLQTNLQLLFLLP